MDKKEVMQKMKDMTIEEKISLLSETEEAYIKGFIEGVILWGYEAEKQNGKAAAKLKSAKAGQKAWKNS